MSSDIETKRAAIASVYRSFNWATKVKGMSEAQVVAIYMKFKKEGKL